MINDITNKLLLVERHTVDCDFINNVSDEICQIFTTSASEAFGTKVTSVTGNTQKRFKKPWFTKHCRSARQNYRKAKRMFKKYGGDIFKFDLYEKEKKYKKILNQSVVRHKLAVKEKLKYLRTSNPREYWKIINSGNARTTETRH